VVIGAGAKVLGGFEVGDGAKVGSNAVVVKPVPAGATAVGNPARIIAPGVDDAARAREAKAEQMGFTAYGVTRDLDDPVSKALHGLLDHAVETDRRIGILIARLAEAGIAVDGAVRAADSFDPKGLGKMVD
jgi:serine O-acetyltransferase